MRRIHTTIHALIGATVIAGGMAALTPAAQALTASRRSTYGVGVGFDEASVPWYRYTAVDVLTGYDYPEEPDVVRHCAALADPGADTTAKSP